MNITIITEQNTTDLVVSDLKETFILDKIKKTGNFYVNLEAEIEKIIELIYKSQFSKRILLTISTGTFTNAENLIEKIKKDLNEKTLNLMTGKTLRTECERTGEHDFNSVHIEQEITNIITDKTKQKTDLKNPDNLIYIEIINDEYAVGIELVKKDLSKRQHKIFNVFNELKGTTAYNMLLFSEIKSKSIIADPFSMGGTITIEAAIRKNNFPVQFYEKPIIKNIQGFEEETQIKIQKQQDKKILNKQKEIYSTDPAFKNISAQKKNAKIAGVEKNIEFSKINAEDLDLKIGENELDLIVTRIIEPSKHIKENKCTKIYEDFLKNVKKPLKKTGTITIIARNPQLFEKIAKEQKYEKIKEKTIMQGKQELNMAIFKNQ
ncbi:hypothetical protein K9M18_00260 [Candidatus Woesearchaeota archaeon]|nr:hypothetical protein [Candidatus Woesearchaeota archaeon]MCF8012959.1 hypothetical protein [Candidatus Woesearchaeota archaeon]